MIFQQRLRGLVLISKSSNCWWIKNLSTKMIKKVHFEQVKEGLGKNEIYLIDVRSAQERVNPGRIPGSLHVPLSDVAQAFSGMTPEEFEAQYDFKRPMKNDPKLIVTTCKQGFHSEQAADVLVQSGYHNVAVYNGSFSDWMAEGGQYIDGTIDQEMLIDFEQLKQALKEQSMLVIDVRNPGERLDPGRIPGTKNVPLNELWEAFATSPMQSGSTFETKYGFARPLPSAPLATHCLRGKRALDASDKLRLLGYANVKVYKGSFLDWKEKGGEVLKGNHEST